MSLDDHWRERHGRTIAFHEAGHAVLACHLGRRLYRVGIDLDAGRGVTETSCPDPLTVPETRNEIMILLAGGEAEYRLASHVTGFSRGACFDWNRAVRLIRRNLDAQAGPSDRRWLDQEASSMSRRLAYEIRLLFAAPPMWRAIRAAAQALLDGGEMSGSAIEAVIMTELRHN